MIPDYSSTFSDYDDEFDHGIVVLSYEGIRVVFPDLAKEFSKFAIALDLTENELTDLSFLRSFNKLESLVLDKNRQMNPKTFPTMKNLKILWLNGCNIPNIVTWIEVIRVKCPKLTRLSLINNPGARSLINLSTSDENEEYRSYVANRLPRLQYLDEAPIVRSGGGLAKSASGQFLAKLFNFHNNNRNGFGPDQNYSIVSGNSTSVTSADVSEINSETVKKNWWPAFKA